MCYFFDPRDLWNRKNFSLHGVCFQSEGFVSNTERRESRFFLCSKGRLGRKVQHFENYISSVKLRYNPDTLPKTSDHGVILLENECSAK